MRVMCSYAAIYPRSLGISAEILLRSSEFTFGLLASFRRRFIISVYVSPFRPILLSSSLSSTSILIVV
jgi:hypothetical protein